MKLFGTLPDTLFGALAHSNRHLHARILMRLRRAYFEDLLSDEPTRDQVQAEIEREIAEGGPDPEDDGGQAEGAGPLHTNIYYALLRAGWFEETRERFTVRVEMPQEVHFLLDCLAKVQDGLDLSYGGAVVEILSSLRPVRDDPVRFALGIANAAEKTRQFARHLKGLTSSLRLVERSLVQQSAFADVCRTFFADFIDKLLVKDFKKLLTQNNPFQLRRDLLSVARGLMADDDQVLEAVAQAYVDQNEAADRNAAMDRIYADLSTVIRVFSSVDTALERINDRQSRIAVRFRNAIIYKSGNGGRQSQGVARALAALAESAGEAGAPGLPSQFGGAWEAYGQKSLTGVRSRRPAPEPAATRVRQANPALASFMRAKNDHAAAVRMNSGRLAAYIEKAMAGADRAEDAAFPLAAAGDLIAFSSLRMVESGFGGVLKVRYRLEILPGAFRHELIECGRFAIVRATRPARSAQRQAKEAA
jgi:hypothetical protein